MNFKQAIKVLRARKRRATGEEAEALAIAIEQLAKADGNREAEIAKAVELIHDAVFDSDGNLHESAWSYIRDRIDFPPDEKALVVFGRLCRTARVEGIGASIGEGAQLAKMTPRRLQDIEHARGEPVTNVERARLMVAFNFSATEGEGDG